jgi:hypothetical protein
MKDYILIKLRSGEELIATITGKNRTNIKVLRPMQIRQVPFVDPRSGSLKAAVVMENWIGRTNENEVTIPNNWVGIKMAPSQEAIEAYEKYMKEDDMPKPSANKGELPLVDVEKEKEEEDFKRLEDEMNKLLMEMTSAAGLPPQSVEGMDTFMKGSSFDKESKESVIVNFMFPASVFRNMMEDGLMEEFLTAGMYPDDNGDDSDEDLEDDVDFVKDKPRKIRENDINMKEKGDETWGNSYRDWSSNPSDYL